MDPSAEAAEQSRPQSFREADGPAAEAWAAALSDAEIGLVAAAAVPRQELRVYPALPVRACVAAALAQDRLLRGWEGRLGTTVSPAGARAVLNAVEEAHLRSWLPAAASRAVREPLEQVRPGADLGPVPERLAALLVQAEALSVAQAAETARRALPRAVREAFLASAAAACQMAGRGEAAAAASGAARRLALAAVEDALLGAACADAAELAAMCLIVDDMLPGAVSAAACAPWEHGWRGQDRDSE